MLDDFLYPLGSGANLAEDSPILALRSRLNKEDESDDLNQPRRLALLIKAFNLYSTNQTVNPKRGLILATNEKFPRIGWPHNLPAAAE